MSIAITPDEMRSTATNLRGDSSDLRATASKLDNEINNLMATWQGAAQTSFIEQYETQYKDLLQNQIPAMVEGLASTLDGVAEAMEQTDQGLAQGISGR
jgi:WXG100 family type VII secretion target